MIRFDELDETDLYQQFILTVPMKQFGDQLLETNDIYVTLIGLDLDEKCATFESFEELEREQEETIYFEQQGAYILHG